ncbi:MAG: ATP-binding protein [Planctomycetota bacterium]
MTPGTSERLRRVLAGKLAESTAAPLPAFTPRVVPGRLEVPERATAVVGMRRVGKTTFLHQVRSERVRGGMPPEQVPYVNFEDERLADLAGDHLDLLLQEHGRHLPDSAAGRRVAWFFDEIQVVPGWERFVRRLLDTGRADVFVTGSSAALLSREIATALRGRAWEVPLFPFGFEEALRHQGAEVPTDVALLPDPSRLRLERKFLEWLSVGGFPEVQGVDEGTRRQILTDHVDVAMLRDVIERHRVSNVVGLRWLVRQLLGNAAGLFSVEKFHAALKSQGIAISRDTVHELLAHLEDCFLVRLVWMESRSERQRMVNPRKAYPVDPGLIPVFDRTGRANLGHALESAVLVELHRRRCDVTYVRTPEGHEVDFLARWPDGSSELIQVSADARDPGTANRELRALAEAVAVHPDAGARLLTATQDGLPAEVPDGITAEPAYEWMLA